MRIFLALLVAAALSPALSTRLRIHDDRPECGERYELIQSGPGEYWLVAPDGRAKLSRVARPR